MKELIERLGIIEGYLIILSTLTFHLLKVLEINKIQNPDVERFYNNILSLRDDIKLIKFNGDNHDANL